MVDNAPIFEVNLTYLYRDKTTITWNDDVKARLGGHCQSILAKMHTEQLSLLEGDPRFTVALSYALEYDYVYIEPDY